MMKKTMKIVSLVLALVLALTAFGACAEEKAYPSRDITYVIPFAAGGGVDVWGRALAAGLSAELGVNVTANNVTGGSAGSTGAESAWKASHDGYTICGTSETPLTIPVMTPIERTSKDYDYFIAAGSPGLVCINAEIADKIGVKTMADLVAYEKRGDLNVAGTAGGLWFALASLLTEQAYGNLGFSFVSYPGSGDAIKAAAGGVDAAIVAASAGEVKDYLDSGKLIALANMDTTPYGNIPSVCDSVPALKPYFPLRQWLGFMIPSDTPQDVKDALTVAFKKVMESNDIKVLAESQSAEIFNLTGAEAKEMAKASESSLCWVLAELGKTQFDPADRGIAKP